MQVIYRITSPSGNVYIGQSKHLFQRLSSYRNLKCKSQKLLFRSLVKYGFEKHTVYIVHKFPELVSQEVIDNYEKYVIKMHRMMGLTLLNMTDGGRGFAGCAPSQKNRDAILKATQGEGHKLSKLSESEVIQIRSNYQKGARGKGIRQLAKKYNISMKLVHNIVNDKTWKHI